MPDSGWLKILSEYFDRFPDCAVGGKTVNILSDNPYSTASQMLIDYLYDYYNADPDQAKFLTSNNFSLPKEKFHAMNGFDTGFSLAAGEDRDFCKRWLNYGYKIIYAPQAVIYHAHRMTLRGFLRSILITGGGRSASADFFITRFRLNRLHFILIS